MAPKIGETTGKPRESHSPVQNPQAEIPVGTSAGVGKHEP